MNYQVLKDNQLFLLTDLYGNIPLDHPYGLGLYKEDTRFLSEMNVTINGEAPILLQSNIDQNDRPVTMLTNPHIEKNGEVELWRESIEIMRTRYISNDILYETVQVKNYNPKPLQFSLEFSFQADFADMFVVRGFQNGELGQKLETISSQDSLVFGYMGADNIKRETIISWEKGKEVKSKKEDLLVPFTLNHSETDEVTFTITPFIYGVTAEVIPKTQAIEESLQRKEEWNSKSTKIETDHPLLQKVVQRSLRDMHTLVTDVGHGPFLVAGLPWFGVPFGRDSLIAALQMLPFNSEIAKGTLRTLAQYQGTKKDAWRDEEPGKIMHEIRYGELARTGQIPFTPYYGTVDATPLFVVLAVEYAKWTKDLSFIEELRPNLEKAIKWIEEYGDRDGDGFVEYHQEASKGIANQGWKDSEDSIVHRSGNFAESPIALAEVQGYVYHALTGMADIYQSLNLPEKSEELKRKTKKLKSEYDTAFWMDEHDYYAIALDHNKQQVGTITSNPGHLLLADLIPQEKLESVVHRLLSKEMFSGYGIRTMAEGEAAYNPMSYHDGSVWPHDNSLILLGLGKQHRQTEAVRVIEGLLQAASHFEYNRLPELFCGYSMEKREVVPYPVACSPQAWAAGTALTFIQTMLGIYPELNERQMKLQPQLLPDMNELVVKDISLGDGQLSLKVYRVKQSYEIEVLKNTTGFEVFLQSTQTTSS
ncbi:Glycogen debranching enzyme (alpha-1,6-glucosidase) [Halobacillus alkaliphilus]|uniref:Glycogen debranching enzyme (Alpha-1,6-glucosidase) n=1 Tax=Halobacillus alkaliphilus TaxID=396056 RepID=A0A1I2KR91_9BACI|nr:amylo-alpha-1,6-glucosidase [Halobacillus alkaliphilus]SFF67426.1 Glycogen debranching enzyme (alpha-1,6-glucosidase) [Halobacillus alkaliphilus]